MFASNDNGACLLVFRTIYIDTTRFGCHVTVIKGGVLAGDRGIFSSRVQPAYPRDTSRLSLQERLPGAPYFSLHEGPTHSREGTLFLVSDARIGRATGSRVPIVACYHVFSFSCKHASMKLFHVKSWHERDHKTDATRRTYKEMLEHHIFTWHDPTTIGSGLLSGRVWELV